MPIPAPMGIGAVLRPRGAFTTSSSLSTSADEPRIPWGLGERTGEPELELPSPLLFEVPEMLGRAMGAMMGRPIGPGSPDMREARRPCPGARESMDGAEGEDDRGMEDFTFWGGPMGATEIPRLNGLSNGGPLPAEKLRGSAEGASTGWPGCWCC